MSGPKLTVRQWIEDLVADTVRLRCSYQRHGKHIVRFTAQLEARQQGAWHAVVRYA